MKNIRNLSINKAKECTHKTGKNNENHHHDEHSSHHHSCTPFCVCGVTHFVLHILRLHVITTFNLTSNKEELISQPTVWAIFVGNYKKLITKDIWHPPQVV